VEYILLALRVADICSLTSQLELVLPDGWAIDAKLSAYSVVGTTSSFPQPTCRKTSALVVPMVICNGVLFRQGTSYSYHLSTA
jgi:hypothetical protein